MKFTNSSRVKAPYFSSDSGCRGNYTAITEADDSVSTTRQPISTESQTRKHQKNMNINCIVSCKRAAQVGTFNIRTAREQHKRIELAELFSRSKLHILALQEHRVVHAEPTRIKKMNKGIHPVISSAWRNAAGASNGRVGIILTRTAYEAISLIKSYSARIHTMSFNRKPRLSVITCYSPTEASFDEEAENLFFLKPSILQLI